MLTSRFYDALCYAGDLHASQTRKGGNVPYLAHLLGVTSTVLEHGGDEDTAIAALLHDAVEDQGGMATAEEIRRRFGNRVAELVLACTDATTDPKPPWRERKQQYIAHLTTDSPDAQLVSLADKINNARSILHDYRQLGDALWTRFTGRRDGTLWYYRAIIAAAQTSPHQSLVAELTRIIDELESLEKRGRE